MKLLFFIQSLSGGGAERVTATLANYWSENGWDVSVVTMSDRGSDFYKLNDAVRRITLDTPSRSRNLMGSVINSIRRIVALRGVLKREAPDVAIGMMTTANYLLAWASIGSSTMLIGTEHTHPPEYPLGRRREWLRKISYKRLTYVVSLTRPTADWLVANAGVSRKKARVIGNPIYYPIPVQEPVVEPERMIQEMGCRYVMLGVGRIVAEKGFDRLIDAFSRLSREFPDWGLVLLGEGPERSILETQVKRLGVEMRVRMPGAVGNLDEWLRVADIYILSSRFEGFSNTLVEAMAYGVPSIAVDCDVGPREIVQDGFDALLVPQYDQDSLVESMKKLMQSDEARRKLSKNATAMRERFSVVRVAMEWEKLFAERIARA